MRYFLMTHVLANALIVVASIASVVLGALGRGDLQMMLLGAAAVSAIQGMFSWTVLQRRVRIRYSLW